jgi:acyl dehydratase
MWTEGGGAVSDAAGKSSAGNYFEDLTTGLELEHAVPRTVTEGDAALYIALTADRYPLHCDAEFARALGFGRMICWSFTPCSGSPCRTSP